MIERGVEYLERGHGWLKSADLKTLRNAASLMMIGGYYLGSVCVVSTSEKKYWDIKTHGPGGITTGRAKQADAAIWQKWVLDEIAAKNAKGDWIKLAALRIADKLKERKQLPVIFGAIYKQKPKGKRRLRQEKGHPAGSRLNCTLAT